MKRIISFILTVIIIISVLPATASQGEMRAVWFSYQDYSSQLARLSESAYRSAAERICQNISASGMNTLVFHARAFSDAFYNSSSFGYSRYVMGTAGTAPGYDPLAIMCDVAHRYGINVHAWINPYRIGSPSNVTADSVAYSWKHSYGEERVCTVNGSWYYNPASPEVREYIVEGVREIALNYPVEGIHFDDYFYPTTDTSFDAASYAASGTSLSINDWRVDNVNKLIRSTYDAIKAINPNILFGISPDANIEKNQSTHYADVRRWCSESGYIDYIVPQIYFGYENATMPFKKVLGQWSSICSVPQLYIGLAAYKAGAEDKWAGAGKWEWTTYNDICARQIEDIRSTSPCGGFMIFSYSSLWDGGASEAAKSELAAIERLTAEASGGTYTPTAASKQIKSGGFSSLIELLKALFNI